jgi:hypothetical protein
MKGSVRKYTDAQLLQIIQDEKTRLGRNPTMADFDSNSALPSSKLITSRFGRWLIALERAGFDVVGHHNSYTIKEIQARKAEIIAGLQQLHRELGRVPKVSDTLGTVGHGAINTYFGSWNNALIAAGLVPVYTKKHFMSCSDAELLQFIKDWHAQHGRIPKISDFNMKEGLPSPATYKKRFGGWMNALKLAGFEPRPFPWKPSTCEYFEGCFIQQGYLSVTKKIALYAAKKLLEFARR